MDSSNSRILLVDDIPENLYSLEQLLKQDGYIIDTALSGEDTLRAVLKEKYDLILLDVQMPGMDGFEVARFLRSNKKTEKIPIIFITALMKDREYIVKGFESGGFDYFIKPILPPEILRNKVKILIQLYRQQEELIETRAQLNELNKKLEIRVEISEQKYTSLFNKSNDATFIRDMNGKILNVNEMAVKLFGYSKKEFQKLHVNVLYPEGSSFGVHNKKVKRNGQSIQEAILHSKDGRTFLCEISAVTIELESGTVVQAIIRDISKKKAAEKELKNQVEERTKELNEALSKEKELNQMKINFVSMASHEFRTPLTSILSASDIIKRYQEKMTKTEVRRKIDKIQNEVKGLVEILEDFLIVGKYEVGKVEFKPKKMDLKFFCDELVDELNRTIGKEHYIDYIFEELEMVVNLDPRLIKHITSNLLSNSIKYSAVGSKIEFHISTRNGFIVIQINDKGIGIPENDLKNIFSTFHRASNVGAVSGSGLGMAIVKQSVDLHNGQIMINSTEGVGTEIEITIPYTK